MESIQELKSRINSIIGTRQITQSMRLVSTVRMRTVRDRMLSNATFLEETTRMALEAAMDPDAFDHPYVRGLKAHTRYNTGDNSEEENSGGGGCTPRSRKCVVVIGADRGLCGGYNVNVYREARALIRRLGDVKLIIVGQKICDLFSQRSYSGADIEKTYTGISETPFFEDAEEIAATALRLYNSGATDAIYIVHTRFINMLTHMPTQTLLLPFKYNEEYVDAVGGQKDEGGENEDMNDANGNGVKDGEAAVVRRIKPLTRYEPACADFLTLATPFYAAAVLFGAILESSVCEQCSRTISMDTAVKNSDEMIDALALKYNKARQNAITAELADIIGGTKALRLKI